MRNWQTSLLSNWSVLFNSNWCSHLSDFFLTTSVGNYSCCRYTPCLLLPFKGSVLLFVRWSFPHLFPIKFRSLLPIFSGKNSRFTRNAFLLFLRRHSPSAVCLDIPLSSCLISSMIYPCNVKWPIVERIGWINASPNYWIREPQRMRGSVNWSWN